MLLAVACLLGSLLTGLPSLPARLACSALPACSFNVLLKASRAGAKNWWISTQVQYRPGSPAGAAGGCRLLPSLGTSRLMGLVLPAGATLP